MPHSSMRARREVMSHHFCCIFVACFFLASVSFFFVSFSRSYGELRKASMVGGGVPMGVRYLESIVRIAEAHARMHLRDHVREEDTNVAIKVLLNSFITSQKWSVARQMQRHFRAYISYKRDTVELALYLLRNMVRDTALFLQTRRGEVPSVIEVERADFASRCSELGISDISTFLRSPLFRQSGFEVDAARGLILRRFGPGERRAAASQ